MRKLDVMEDVADIAGNESNGPSTMKALEHPDKFAELLAIAISSVATDALRPNNAELHSAIERTAKLACFDERYVSLPLALLRFLSLERREKKDEWDFRLLCRVSI